MLNATEQMKIIKKGVMDIIDEQELYAKLERSISTNKPLTIKLGLDPSAPDIHLGHAVVLRKIKQLQDLGHKAIIIIGDFTGRIGDPSGKSKTRNQLTEKEVLKNADTYQKQIFSILDPEKTTLLFNSSWLGELKFDKILELCAKYTVSQMLQRDDFKNRFQANQPIGLHEFFYPLMQAYDSLEINADIEIGGNDQRFNILMGRDLQSKHNNEKQIAIFMPLLEGIDGTQKMSKSLGNYVGIDEPAKVQFEKIMQVPDSLMITYFELATDLHPDVINDLSNQLSNNLIHPRDLKLRLAEEITSLYHSKEETLEARKYFISVYSEGINPKDIQSISWKEGQSIIEIMVKAKFVSSKSEARRLVTQNGVRINGEVINNIEHNTFNHGDVIKVGKNRFAKISL